MFYNLICNVLSRKPTLYTYTDLFILLVLPTPANRILLILYVKNYKSDVYFVAKRLLLRGEKLLQEDTRKFEPRALCEQVTSVTSATSAA